MFFCLMFVFHVLFCVQCEIWTQYKYSSNHNKEMDSYLTRCARTAEDKTYCAARINRVTFTCEPLPVFWCQDRIKVPGYFYMEKVTVNETTEPIRNNAYRFFSTSIPVLMEPGTEITMGFTPQPIMPELEVLLFPDPFNVDYAMKLVVTSLSELHLKMRIKNATSINHPHFTWVNQPPVLRYPHTLHQMSVLTLRCTIKGLEVIVDGDLLCQFYNESFKHTTRKLRINVHDFTTKFHFVSYTAAVH